METIMKGRINFPEVQHERSWALPWHYAACCASSTRRQARPMTAPPLTHAQMNCLTHGSISRRSKNIFCDCRGLAGPRPCFRTARPGWARTAIPGPPPQSPARRSSFYTPQSRFDLDGSGITLLNRAENFYGTIPTKGSLDEVLDTASDRFGIAMPLDDFLRSDPHRISGQGDRCQGHRPGQGDGHSLRTPCFFTGQSGLASCGSKMGQDRCRGSS